MILNLKKYEKKYFGISLFMQHVYICPKACSESWLSNFHWEQKGNPCQECKCRRFGGFWCIWRYKNIAIIWDGDEDIKVGDSIVISKGAKAYAKVLVAKKSGIAGTKGKLKVEWLYCVANNNTKVPLEGEIDFSRKNHTSGAVVAGTIVAAPLIFLTGQHAAIPAGYTNVTTVKIDTEL